MNEDTLIKTMQLPNGRLWEWFADANLVVLSPCLDQDGREAAISELQAQWRRTGIRVIQDEEADSPGKPTEPFQLPQTPRRAG